MTRFRVTNSVCSEFVNAQDSHNKKNNEIMKVIRVSTKVLMLIGFTSFFPAFGDIIKHHYIQGYRDSIKEYVGKNQLATDCDIDYDSHNVLDIRRSAILGKTARIVGLVALAIFVSPWFLLGSVATIFTVAIDAMEYKDAYKLIIQ